MTEPDELTILDKMDEESAEEFVRMKEAELELRENLPFLYGWKWYPWAKQFFDSTNRLNFLCAANQISKPNEISTPIPTPKGFVAIGDLSVGDYVFAQDGTPTQVVGIPFEGEEDSYELEFSDGSTVVAGGHHLWVCKGNRQRFRKFYRAGSRKKNSPGAKFPNTEYGQWVVRTTKQIIADGGYSPGTTAGKRFVIPVAEPVQYAEKQLFDPYFVGIYLGNGCASTVTFHSDDTDLIRHAQQYGGAVSVDLDSTRANVYIPRATLRKLKDLGVVEISHKKKIPPEYLLGSVEQRKALLAGLLDTDGTCSKAGTNYNFSSTSKVMAEQVRELVASLGGIAQIQQRESYYYGSDGRRVDCQDHYVVTFWTTFNPFRSLRKAARWRFSTKYKHERVITKITPVGKKRVRCISVAHRSETYLCTRNYLVTHNSSTQIRKCIHWATNPALWPSLWVLPPSQFWYLYPSAKQVRAEFETKWQQFLPKGRFKTERMIDGKPNYYAWQDVWIGKELYCIDFFVAGVKVYFKTYTQDVQNLQTGTVNALFCFVAGTKIATPHGEKAIESLKIGDWVHTHSGPRRVVRVQSKEATVITRSIGGTLITGTPDHPFWTQNQGWKQFGALTEEDHCVQLPEWLRQESSDRSKLSFFKGSSTREGLTQKTSESGITSVVLQGSFSMSCSGKPTMAERFQTVMSCITKMTTLWTTGLRTWLCSPGKSTPGTTNGKSGSSKESIFVSAWRVAKTFFPAVARRLSHGSALSSAAEDRTDEARSVYVAVAALLREKILRRCTVEKPAPTEQRQAVVYNIEVEGAHSYFANGLLVHNCDEELNIELYEELMFRLSASDGYFHMVFTATLGQDFWRQVMEPLAHEEERLPDAAKWTVSMYDCMHYEDGTPSHWTADKIATVRARCSTHKEVLKRVYGKFVKDDGGMKYEAFDIKRHFKPEHPLPEGWLLFSGVDPGSGGNYNHPAAICFVGVSPDFRQGRVFKAWRGDNQETSSGDVLAQYQRMKGNQLFVGEYYDWSDKDFDIIQGRMGMAFQPADKSHTKGEQIINTLFKNDMLFLYDNSETRKLGSELASIRKDTPKNKAKDDLADALRYAVSRIPWDWTVIEAGVSIKAMETPLEVVQTPAQRNLAERRAAFFTDTVKTDYQKEFDEWNDLYG